jgi:amino acid transporter
MSVDKQLPAPIAPDQEPGREAEDDTGSATRSVTGSAARATIEDDAKGSAPFADPPLATVANEESRLAPSPLPLPEVDIPERLLYRLKNRLLGPPLATERQSEERLGKIAALGVLSPDCISSSAYGTEEMLRVLIPVVGVAAFTLVLPVTGAILFVLLLVTLSYREVVQVYTKAGGSYVVARENFGPRIAQIAAVALIIDYTVTVAVQIAAGTDALVSAIPSLVPMVVPISVGVVLVMAWGNLRGIREASRMFAFPTYFFIVSMGLVVMVGIVKALLGDLATRPIHVPGAIPIGHPGGGLLMGASVFIVLRSFANGGSSLTGLEAISNGVSAFRPPEGRNARITLVVMSTVLGTLVLGVSLLAHFTHAVPYVSGAPTVISQEARSVFGHGPIGDLLFYAVQLATMLILYTGGNTSFNGFPFLTSFVAGDSFLPRQLEKRGHRLAYSNGIIILTIAAVVLLVVTRAQVDSLVGVYAIGVFTGFTMAGAGMVVHHLREREPAWKRRLVVNGSAAILSGAVVIIFAVTKFAQGAWVVVVLFPILVFALIRMHRQYAEEAAELESGAAQACEAPILRRHAVVILVDRLDLATARAIQYARVLAPDDLRAVHFAIDPQVARTLRDQWSRLGLSRMPLDIVDCPDRRLARAAMELASETVAAGDTELTILLPRRGFGSGWRRLLHDRSADRIAAAVSQVPHTNATIVPYLLHHPVKRSTATKDGADASRGASTRRSAAQAKRRTEEADGVVGGRLPGTIPIAEATWRKRVRVAGRVRSVRVPTAQARANLQCVLADDTGAILLVFQGRRSIAGLGQGARLIASGMVGSWEGQRAILNPDYELISGPEVVEDPPGS